MRVLFINLADPKILGEKSAEALKKKYKPSFLKKEKVTIVQMMSVALEYAKTGVIPVENPEIAKLKFWLKNRDKKDKIIIGAHGENGDTDNCYAESDEVTLHKTHKLLSYTQFAHFLKILLSSKEQTYPFNIILSICYSARSSQNEKDHIKDLFQIDLHSSFAAKVFLLLTPEVKLKMTAVTGSVQIDPFSGSILVESEEGILASKLHQRLVRELKLLNSNLDPLVKEFLDKHGEEQWITYITKDGYKKNTTQLDKFYNRLVFLDESLSQTKAMEVNSNKKRYGKIVLEYNEDKDEISFTLKHQGKKELIKIIKRKDVPEITGPNTASIHVETEVTTSSSTLS